MKALFLWERDSRAEYSQILADARQGQARPLNTWFVFGTPGWEKFLRLAAKSARDPTEDVATFRNFRHHRSRRV